MTDVGKKLAAAAAAGFLAFLILLLVGIVRSLFEEDELIVLPSPPNLIPLSSSIDEYRSRRQTASNLAQIGLADAPLPKILDEADVNKIRVFEKTAQMSSVSTTFGADEQRIRKAIVGHQAAVFNEKATGIAPERTLSLGISVPPGRFDDMVAELTKVGQIASLDVEQRDRTGEFRQLHVQRQSLKKHQEALLKLRDAVKLSVEEALKLEQKIQDVEKEIQAAGVQLGDLVAGEPSYNLFLSLQEILPGSGSDRNATLPRRLGAAFLWSCGWFIAATFLAGLLAATYRSVRALWPRRDATG